MICWKATCARVSLEPLPSPHIIIIGDVVSKVVICLFSQRELWRTQAGSGALGLALFKDASSLNHSCEPNAALSVRVQSDSASGRCGVVLEARVVGAAAVKAGLTSSGLSSSDTPKNHATAHSGVELRCSYLAHGALLCARSARRTALRAAFAFDCLGLAAASSHKRMERAI